MHPLAGRARAAQLSAS